LIDRLRKLMLVFDRSKVRVSLPVPRLTERFPLTPLMVTAPAWPLMVVPASGVSLIWLAAGWLIVSPIAPLSLRVRLPATRLEVMLPARARRLSSVSEAGRKRIGVRADADLRRSLPRRKPKGKRGVFMLTP